MAKLFVSKISDEMNAADMFYIVIDLWALRLIQYICMWKYIHEMYRILHHFIEIRSRLTPNHLIRSVIMFSQPLTAHCGNFAVVLVAPYRGLFARCRLPLQLGSWLKQRQRSYMGLALTRGGIRPMRISIWHSRTNHSQVVRECACPHSVCPWVSCW